MINDWPCLLIVSSDTILDFASSYKEEWVGDMGTGTDTDREWPWDFSVCWPRLQTWQTAPGHSQAGLMLWRWGHWAGKTFFKVGRGFMAWEFKREGESGDCVKLSKSNSWRLESYSKDMEEIWAKDSSIAVNILLQWVDNGGRGTGNGSVDIFEEL